MSSREAGYNGWTNYETWSVTLIMDNDQGLYNARCEAAQDAWDNAEPGEYEWQTREAEAEIALADWLKDFVEEYVPDMSREPLGMLYSQLLTGALSEVNWREIAEHWIQDVEKDAEEPAEEPAE